MKLLNPLKKLGEKVKLVKIVDRKPDANAAKEQTKSMTLAELTQMLEEERQRGASPIMVECSKDFNQTFEDMKVKRYQHGWTIGKLASVLSSSQSSAKKQEDIKRDLTEILRTNNVPVVDMLADARNSLQALDSFETQIKKELMEMQSVRIREIEGYKKEIEHCQEHIKHLTLVQSRDESALESWKIRKAEKQKEIQRLISIIS
jgi:hypothetical protein